VRKYLTITVLVTAVAAMAVSSAFAAPWPEAGDAGDLTGAAQIPNGVGNLTSITGVAGSGDADLYRICLTGGGTFSATTIGSALFDTQLFLFDNAGMGVEANDDGGVALKAVLPAGGLSPAAGGVYYLGLSSFNRDPVSAGGLIFPSSPFGPVYGPTGPGGASPLSGWAGGDGSAAAYLITLTGARFCRQDAAAIDIKPGSGVNPVNLKSKGVIPVAIITTPDFDAASVDVDSVCFGDAGDFSQHACDEAHGQGHLEDVDGDADLDLVLHFRTQDTGIDAGDTEACLTASTIFGESIFDCDAITTVP
jgi:hypothetical protein